MAPPLSSSVQTLTSNVSVYAPLQTPYNSSNPRLIILFSWYAAAEPHIAKYTAGHQSLFPSSTILLVRCPQSSIFFPRSWTSSIAPAVEFITSWKKEHGDDGNILVHKFSNGGIGSFIKVSEMLSALDETFPKHTMIMDSCPGYFHWKRTHSAIMASMPSWASPLIHAGMALNWALTRPWGHENPMDVNAKRLNGGEVRDLQRRRLYVYGTGDAMVDWKDVEWHADEARFGRADGKEEPVGKRKGEELEIRLEKFEGGRHVANVRVDGERYWGAVRTVWED